MTPKEKAKELVDKYYNFGDQEFDYSKEFALIALDEMIDIRNGLYINEGSIAHQWLLDVKHEIEKL
jgi:hypothetical protein